MASSNPTDGGAAKVPVLQSAKIILRAKKAGIKQPLLAYNCAKKVKLDYAVACTILTLETGGGTNEFGHDPTIYVGAGEVTKKKYLAYRAEARRTGKRQGVGPMQLTSAFLQDQADGIGGCWDPRSNMIVGFHYLHDLIQKYGVREAFYHWNGSRQYADRAMRELARWQKLLFS